MSPENKQLEQYQGQPKKWGPMLAKVLIPLTVVGALAYGGWRLAQDNNQSPAPPVPEQIEGDLVSRGRDLFSSMGCVGCHGPLGRGGVPNRNYINDTMPALNSVGENMGLYSEEEAQELTDIISRGEDLRQADTEYIFQLPRVAAQFSSYAGIIRDGNIAGKRDPAGPDPLDMPGWGGTLSDREIDAILLYLVSLQSWEEE